MSKEQKVPVGFRPVTPVHKPWEYKPNGPALFRAEDGQPVIEFVDINPKGK